MRRVALLPGRRAGLISFNKVNSRWCACRATQSGFGPGLFLFRLEILGLARPFTSKDLGVNAEHLGRFLTWPEVIQGVSRFLNGFPADRANAPVFMVTVRARN